MRVVRLIVNWTCLLVVIPIIGGSMFTLSFMWDAAIKLFNARKGYEYKVMAGKEWIW